MPVVLVADDSETIQKVVRIALARQSLKVEAAASWSEAEGRLGPQVAVILLDANLPGVGGDQVKLKDVLARAGGVPVVVMQGSHDRSLSDNDLAQAGIRHSIQKPFDSGELIRIVTSFLGSTSAVPQAQTSAFAAATPAPPPPAFDPFPAAARSSLDLQLDSLPPLPADLVDSSRKGKKAFEGTEDTVPYGSAMAGISSSGINSSPSTLPPPPPPPRVSGGQSAAPAVALGQTGSSPQPQVPGPEMQAALREAVLEYCQKHFKDIAIEVISAELRRLAEERARHLVDI
jgi:CheY-like chemotaxis protein